MPIAIAVQTDDALRPLFQSPTRYRDWYRANSRRKPPAKLLAERHQRLIAPGRTDQTHAARQSLRGCDGHVQGGEAADAGKGRQTHGLFAGASRSVGVILFCEGRCDSRGGWHEQHPVAHQ